MVDKVFAQTSVGLAFFVFAISQRFLPCIFALADTCILHTRAAAPAILSASASSSPIVNQALTPSPFALNFVGYSAPGGSFSPSEMKAMNFFSCR